MPQVHPVELVLKTVQGGPLDTTIRLICLLEASSQTQLHKWSDLAHVGTGDNHRRIGKSSLVALRSSSV